MEITRGVVMTISSPRRSTMKTTILLAALLVSTTALAQFTPRQNEVNGRLENQNQRIQNELNQGEISDKRANQLRQQDNAIRQQENAMKNMQGGRITPAEQKALNQQENAISKRIGQ